MIEKHEKVVEKKELKAFRQMERGENTLGGGWPRWRSKNDEN
jgi:hypothetical protein